MPINYPTSLDSLSNPAGSDTLAAPSHSAQHANANDAIEALEAKLGINSSTPISGKPLTGVGVGQSQWTDWDHGGRHSPLGADAPPAGVPGSSAVGDSANQGSADSWAMSDHRHGREAFGTTAAAIGTSAGGSATTPSHSDHVHATGAGTPSTQAIGDAATIGSGPAASMTDHKHAITNPLTTQYDLWMGGASGAPGRLAKGSNFQRLDVDGSGVVAYHSQRGFEGHATGQSVANNSDDPIEWTEDTDTDGFHSGTSNAIVIPTGMGGWYLIEASCQYSASVTERLTIVKGGSTTLAYGIGGTTGTQRGVVWLGKLAAADSITIVAFYNGAGGTVDAQVAVLFLGP